MTTGPTQLPAEGCLSRMLGRSSSSHGYVIYRLLRIDTIRCLVQLTRIVVALCRHRDSFRFMRLVPRDRLYGIECFLRAPNYPEHSTQDQAEDDRTKLPADNRWLLETRA